MQTNDLLLQLADRVIDRTTEGMQLMASLKIAVKASKIDPEPGYVVGSTLQSPTLQIKPYHFVDRLKLAQRNVHKQNAMLKVISDDVYEAWFFRTTYWLVASINGVRGQVTFEQHCLDLTNPAPGVFVNACVTTLVDAPKDLCALFEIPVPANLSMSAVQRLLRQYALEHYESLARRNSKFQYVGQYRAATTDIEGEGHIPLYDSPYLLCIFGGRYYPIPLDDSGKWLDEPQQPSASELWFLFLDRLKELGQTNPKYARIHRGILHFGNQSNWGDTPDSYYRLAAAHAVM